MSSPQMSSPQTIFQQAHQQIHAGNYTQAIVLLRPLLPRMTTPREKLSVLNLLTFCHRGLDDFKNALPLTKKEKSLVIEVFSAHSREHASALQSMCLVYQGLEKLDKAQKAINSALSIMVQLHLQRDQECGSMLIVLARLQLSLGQNEDALANYVKAKDIFEHASTFVTLLNEIAICHETLLQWNEAVVCHKEYVERSASLHGINHPEYATGLFSFACLYSNLKQYEEAIPLYEQALVIRKKIFGDRHESTVRTLKALNGARQNAQESIRGLINVGHDFRMCNQCGVVKEHMDVCKACIRVWYCDADCQLQHWSTHKPQCNVCFWCGTTLAKQLRCKCCKIAKYCGVECQKADWVDHKKDCVKAK